MENTAPQTQASSIVGTKVLRDLRAAFAVNGTTTPSIERLILIGFLSFLVLVWVVSPSKILPNPAEVIAAFPRLWTEEGLGIALFTSLTLNFQAIGLMSLVSLLVAYGTAIPALRPIASAFSIARFNGFVGLPLLLTLMVGDQHWIKVILLVIAMSVFTVPAIVSIIETIPKEAYDHARVLRMNEWRVLWEVVIIGKFHEVLDALRISFAIGWMMLPMVEGLFRSEGGIGVLILTENKYFKLDAVYALIIFQTLLGLAQDVFVRTIKMILCPYATLTTERK